MAAGRWCRVLTGCRMHALMRDHTCGILLLKKSCPIRQFAAVKCFLSLLHSCHSTRSCLISNSKYLQFSTTYNILAQQRASKKVQTDPKKESNKPKVERKTNSYRNRTRGLTALEPIDDVYQVQYYPKPLFAIETAIDSLKKFQQLDFTYPKQPVYIDLQLDMKLEKKKKVDPFVRILQLPYNFRTQLNSVVVFTENPEEVTVAQQHGADVVGGTELIQKILDEEVQGDFYVSTPDMVSKLVPLKNKLRKKFPKNKRGSVGHNIPEMIKVFQTGHEYQVERDCFVLSKVGTLDMPKEHITANVAEIIKDVCTQRPVSFGPFVKRAIICSATSESLMFKAEPFLPQITEDKEENQEHNG